MNKDHILGISLEGFHNIAFTEWGSHNPKLPTVICVHGYTRNGRDFDALASYLSLHDRHVFCPDIVGRGESSWFKHSEYYNFTQYISDMNALIARTGAHEIDWLGTSMGGIIGMMLAALPNSPIRRLILNDVGAQIPAHGLKKLGFAERKTEFKSFEEAKDYYKRIHAEFGDLTDEEWEHLTEHSIIQRSKNLFVCKLDPAIRNPKSTMQFITDFFRHPYKSFEGVLYDIDLWSIWSQIRCPVLVIHGLKSEILTSPIIHAMQRAHGQVHLYEIEEVGHAPALLDEQDHEVIHDWLG